MNKDRPAPGGPGLQDAYTGLVSALRVVESGDRAVPSQAIAVYQESSRQVKARVAEWANSSKPVWYSSTSNCVRPTSLPSRLLEIEQEIEFLI